MAKESPEFKEKFGKSGGEAGKGHSMGKSYKGKKGSAKSLKIHGRKK